VGVIHQELSLFPDLSVTDNVFMARERTRHGVVVDRGLEERRVAETLARLEHPLDPRTLVGRLPLGLQQIVEIARALVQDVKILMMDEPTSALSAVEVAALFRVIRDLVERGVAVVYISHRLEELMQIGDRITVLRDGRRVAHAPVSDVDLGWIVENMVGRSARPRHDRHANVDGADVLEVKGVSLPGPAGGRRLDRVSLSVRRGEIVALYGLMGAGRTELLESLAGARGAVEGLVEVDGDPVQGLSLPERIRRGLTLIPEDRQGAGVVPPLSVTHNVTLSSLQEHTRSFWLVGRKERATVERMRGELDIRMADPNRPITALSGGNQQKVVVARALLTSPRVLLMDEPTRGIDVAARAEIFDLMHRLADQGLAILYSSSDLKEVVGIADRVVVLSGGRVTGEFDGLAVSEQKLVEASYVGHNTSPEGGQDEG
jgi:erythritol transport system ATP-binding protein